MPAENSNSYKAEIRETFMKNRVCINFFQANIGHLQQSAIIILEVNGLITIINKMLRGNSRTEVLGKI